MNQAKDLTVKSDSASCSYVEYPATRGIQRHREFYSVMVEMREIARVCMSADQRDEEVPLQFRRQRPLSALRSNNLFRYLLKAALTKGDFVIPALTCTTHPIEWIGEGFAGSIKVNPLHPWFLADGQHRVSAIKKLKTAFRRGEADKRKFSSTEKYNLEWMLSQHVPVTLFHECGHKGAQQLFVDINRNSSKPPKALMDAFDHRSKLR